MAVKPGSPWDTLSVCGHMMSYHDSANARATCLKQQRDGLLEAAEAMEKTGSLEHRRTDMPNATQCRLVPDDEFPCGACSLEAAIKKARGAS